VGFLVVSLVTLPVRSLAEAEATTTSKVARTKPRIFLPGTSSRDFLPIKRHGLSRAN